MILLAAALQVATSPAWAGAPSPDPCATICDARRLKPYFEKLTRIGRAGGTVRILQLGDSHTAGDQITGAWRAALQSRYGNAGRGVLPPGRPYQGYLTRDVTARQGPGWRVSGIFGAAYSSANTIPIGASGYSLTSLSDGAQLSIDADSGNFDNFAVCALTGPGAGTLTLMLGSVVRPVPLAADRVETHCERVDAIGSTASLAVADGRVTITSWATERATPGVILSNLGTVGAQLIHFGRTDDRVVAAEVAQYHPDLLVVAFGTNEAFMPRFSGLEYGARLRGALGRLKRLFPDTPMLLLGAPDSATTQAPLKAGESGSSPDCPPSPDAVTTDWRPTAALATVQATQRRVAHYEGAAFWDWSRAMGGRCTAHGWVRSGLMRPDHVHFTSTGGAEIARRLQADLDAAAFTVGSMR